MTRPALHALASRLFRAALARGDVAGALQLAATVNALACRPAEMLPTKRRRVSARPRRPYSRLMAVWA